jgi:hypothetical protein
MRSGGVLGGGMGLGRLVSESSTTPCCRRRRRCGDSPFSSRCIFLTE